MSLLDELESEAKAVIEKAVEYGEHEIALLVVRLGTVVHKLIQGAKGTPAVPAVPAVPPVNLGQNEG
jgi:hypothetical protein